MLAVLLFAADAITHQQRVAIWTRQPSSQTVYTAGSNAASSAAGSNAASSAWATNHSPFSSVTATSGQQANSTLALLTTPSDGSAGGFGTGGVSGGSGDDYGSGGFGGLPPLAFAYPAFSGGAISAAAELQWTLLLAAGMAAGNDALVQHVHDTFDLLALFKLYYSNGSNETRPLHHPGLEPALEEVMRQPPPLTLDHVQRLPRWPFLEIAARFHPLAGPPCRPNGRQGSGFDSPWRAAVGTTWFRRRHRYKPLVSTPPPSCR